MQERARRREFPAFPYSPYEIQQELMEQIWQVLGEGKSHKTCFNHE